MRSSTAKSDDKQVRDKPQEELPSPINVGKELEPQRDEEKKLLNEVVEVSEQQDREAERKLQESIGDEARFAQPHPSIPADVEDSGVVSPQKEASKVVANGSTIELPISEEEFEAGEKVRVGGNVSDKEVFGVFSVAGFVMYIGRVIKLAHKLGKRVIFRKKEVGNAN